MSTRQPQRTVLVAGQEFDAWAVRHAPEQHQDALRLAKSRFGSAICRCSKEPMPLVIRERQGNLFLAAWPDQASQHAFDCPFYGGARTVLGNAIETDGATTRVNLHRVLLQANRRLGQAIPEPKPLKAGTPPNKLDKFHLWGLLHYLWSEAGLNRWSPGWHRDWGFVRHALRRVAQSTYVGDDQLIQSLYVPPVWSEKHRAEIRQHWDQFVAPLHKHNRTSDQVASGLVIGQVRDLQPSEFGFSLKLHHHAAVFYMNQAMADVMAKYSRRGWTALKHLDPVVGEDLKGHVVAALRVEASRTGGMVIVEGVLMRVSPRYIPINSSYEDKLARLLVKEDRLFVRPLHFDNHGASMPDFVLHDTGPGHQDATALYVYGPASGAMKQRILEQSDRQAADKAGHAFWRWNAGEEAQPPPLPPRVR